MVACKQRRVTPAVWKNWKIVADKTFELSSKSRFILVFHNVKNLMPLVERAQELGLVVYNDLPEQVAFRYISSKRDFHPIESHLNMNAYSAPIEAPNPKPRLMPIPPEDYMRHYQEHSMNVADTSENKFLNMNNSLMKKTCRLFLSLSFLKV